MVGLYDLPPELIQHILCCADLQCLLRCRQTCKQLNQFILRSTPLQYKIELCVEGLEDGPPGGKTTAERLQILRQRKEAWNELRFSASQTMPVAGDFWVLLGGVLAETSSEGRMDILQHSSELRGVQEKRWVVEDLHMNALLLTLIDPAQDLLILLDENESGQFIVDLRSLRTGKSHPGAHTPIFPLCSNMRGWDFELIISSEHMATFVLSEIEDSLTPVYRLFVHNWKTGNLELDLSAERQFGFFFLSDEYLLFSHKILSHGVEDCEQVALNVFNLQAYIARDTHAPLSLHALEFECQLLYPSMSPGTTVRDTHIHSDPPPSWKPEASLKVPFHKAPGERALVITSTIDGLLGTDRLVLIVLSSTIAEHVHCSGQKNRRVNWDEWGPSGSRLILSPFQHDSPWQAFVYGTSVLHMNFYGPALRSLPIRLYDFGQLGAKKYQVDSAAGLTVSNLQYSAHSSLGPQSCNNIFLTPELFTSLPARVLETILPLDHDLTNLSNIMLSEDAIILVYNSVTVRKYQVLSF